MGGTHGPTRGHSATWTQSGRLPPVSPPSPAGPERSGGPRRAKPGGVEGGERGDTIESAADGNVIDWTRARGPVCWRVEPTEIRNDQGLARDRGRGVRFTLHAEGRVANRRINRARVTAAKACT